MAGMKRNIMGRIGALLGFGFSAHRACPGRDKRVNIDRLMPAGFGVVWIMHWGYSLLVCRVAWWARHYWSGS